MTLPKTIDDCISMYMEMHGDLPKIAPCDDDKQVAKQYAYLMESVAAKVLNGDWVPNEEEGKVIKMWPKGPSKKYYITTIEGPYQSQFDVMKSTGCFSSGVLFKSGKLAAYAAENLLGQNVLLTSRGLV